MTIKINHESITYKGYRIVKNFRGVSIYCGSSLVESGLHSFEEARVSIDQFGE